MPVLKTIFTEGGASNYLINAYGPTECCIFCLAHSITVKDIQAGSVSIGKPIGRRGRQVKIRGFRIELEAVEAAMLKTGELAETVALKVNAGPEEAAGSMLVAFAVPASESGSQAALNVVNLLKAVLPNYMVPKIELLQKMPLNSHGKVDRKRLEQLCRERWVKQPSVDRQNGGKKQDELPVKRWCWLVGEHPGFPASPADDDADFFLLGATSLQASLLISQMRRAFDKEVSLLTLYDNSSLDQLTGR